MSKKLKLALNIGTADAQRLGLDKVKAGETVDVESKEAADELLHKGWAVEPGQDAPQVAAAPAPAPVVAAVPVGPPDFDAMTKEDLKAYADDQKIDGVTMAMAKDDMVRHIKRAKPAR
jgi:hypothetical protein